MKKIIFLTILTIILFSLSAQFGMQARFNSVLKKKSIYTNLNWQKYIETASFYAEDPETGITKEVKNVYIENTPLKDFIQNVIDNH